MITTGKCMSTSFLLYNTAQVQNAILTKFSCQVPNQGQCSCFSTMLMVDQDSRSALRIVSVRKQSYRTTLLYKQCACFAFNVLWDVLECLILQWSRERYTIMCLGVYRKSDLVN